MSRENRTVEQKIAAIATAAHGTVATREMLAAGISEDEIRWRARSGLLIREFRGVYRAGHRAPSVDARYVAAVKACGDGALLDGLAAAWFWMLVRGPAPRPEVTAPTERRIAGIKTHRGRRMDPRDATIHRGIPIKTVAATIIALPSLLSFDELAKAIHEADVKHGIRPEHIEEALARHPTMKGAGPLRTIIHGDAELILSKLEKLFLALLRRYGMPIPKTNRKKGRHYVDCRWPDHRLIVELDSYRFHRSRHAWEQDHERERAARARGDEFRRYTWTDVAERPAPMLADLRGLLSG